jgi:hypothetical protein
MTNYVSFLLELDAAKRMLAQLFESETSRPADHQSTEIAPPDRSRTTRTSVEKNDDTLQEYCRTRTLVGSRIRTAIPTTGSGETERDLIVFGFMLALVLVGIALAIHTDQPVLWLLIGPAPLVVLHTVRMSLRWRVIRREGLLTFL